MDDQHVQNICCIDYRYSSAVDYEDIEKMQRILKSKKFPWTKGAAENQINFARIAAGLRLPKKLTRNRNE